MGVYGLHTVIQFSFCAELETSKSKLFGYFRQIQRNSQLSNDTVYPSKPPSSCFIVVERQATDFMNIMNADNKQS